MLFQSLFNISRFVMSYLLTVFSFYIFISVQVVLWKCKKFEFNRFIRKANPGSSPDPKSKIIISLVPIELFSADCWHLLINYCVNIFYKLCVMSLTWRHAMIDFMTSWRHDGIWRKCVASTRSANKQFSSVPLILWVDKCSTIKINCSCHVHRWPCWSWSLDHH